MLALLAISIGPAATKENKLMVLAEQTSEKINPKAPAALSRFAFLIGSWQCDARLQSADGGWQTLRVEWVGQFILDGYAIADEYRMMNGVDDLIVFGINFRTVDSSNGAWTIKWLNALTGTWTDLVSDNSGKISIDDESITYAFKEPTADHPYTRATYTNIFQNHFTWLGEKSNDGKEWSKFLIVECSRHNS